jgi:hypothetical protein
VCAALGHNKPRTRRRRQPIRRPEDFRRTQIELGVSAAVVLGLAVSFFLISRSGLDSPRADSA